MFVGLTDERVDLLLEWQFHADAHGAFQCLGPGRVRAFIRGLHQARAAAADDIATHLR
jgi:hypothetical protein